MNWTCASCGPIKDALPGSPGEFHCSGLDCDLKVELIKTTLPKTAIGKFTALAHGPPVKKGRPKKSAAKEEISSIREGREILKRMNARNRGAKPKPRTKVESMGRKPDYKNKPCDKCEKEFKPAGARSKYCDECSPKTKSGRNPSVVKPSVLEGICGECGKEKSLVRKDPPTCSRCWVKIKKKKKRKSKRSRKSGSRKKTRRTKATVTKVDDLDQELAAIGDVSRAIESLSPQALERVLGYSLNRYSQRRGIDGPSPVTVRLLPAHE